MATKKKAAKKKADSSSAGRAKVRPAAMVLSTDSAVSFQVIRSKPLVELRAADVPRGLDPEDVASDF